MTRLAVAALLVLGVIAGCAGIQNVGNSRTLYYQGLTLTCNLETGQGVLRFDGRDIQARCGLDGLLYRWDWDYMADRGTYRYSVIARDEAARFYDFSNESTEVYYQSRVFLSY